MELVFIYEFLGPLATSIAPIILVLGMLRRFGIIGPEIDPTMGVAAPRAPVGGWDSGHSQNFGHGPSLSFNCYLEHKLHKKCRVNPTSLKSLNIKK